MNESTLDKLRKLLSMSKTGAYNENEAQIALQKAMQIATQAGIDLAYLAATDTTSVQEKEEMAKEAVEFGQRLPVMQKYAGWIISNCFKVRVIYSGSRYTGRRIYILGERSEVEFAKFAHDFIIEDMDRRWSYYKRSKDLSTRYKGTWCYNCYLGLKSILEEAKQKEETTRFAAMPESLREDVAGKYQMILSDSTKRVDDFVKTQFSSLRKGAAVRTTNYGGSVASDGFATGRTMRINRPLNGGGCGGQLRLT